MTVNLIVTKFRMLADVQHALECFGARSRAGIRLRSHVIATCPNTRQLLCVASTHYCSVGVLYKLKLSILVQWLDFFIRSGVGSIPILEETVSITLYYIVVFIQCRIDTVTSFAPNVARFLFSTL